MLTDYYQQEKEKEILKDMYMYQDIIEQVKFHYNIGYIFLDLTFVLLSD